MKNITVSVPDEVYYAARVKAAEMRTSVSALVRDQLATLAGHASEFEQRRQHMNELLDQHRLRQASGPHFSSADNLTRDETHDRTR